MKCVRIIVVVTAAILITSTSFADVGWVGTGGDRNWDNPNNWRERVGDPPTPTGPARVPLEDEDAFIDGPAGQTNKPLIADGMEAICSILITEVGMPTIEMTGGHLEMTGWGSWIGDGPGNIATFEMKGGTVDYTGSTGVLELGWQPSGSPAGSCKGIWNMTGGVVNAKGVSMPGGGGALAEMNLDGGQMNVGTSRGGLMLHDDDASLDITAGILVLEGDDQLDVQSYIDFGRLTAYDGTGTVVYDYDNTNAGMTTVIGLPTPGIPGDANLDKQVDVSDLGILATNYGTTSGAEWGDADFTADGAVDVSDLGVLATWYGFGAAAAAVPEPSMLMLLAVGGLTLIGRRRR